MLREHELPGGLQHITHHRGLLAAQRVAKLSLVVPISLLDFGLLPQMQILVGDDWTAGLSLHIFDRE